MNISKLYCDNAQLIKWTGPLRNIIYDIDGSLK